jgi:hypothetical protein
LYSPSAAPSGRLARHTIFVQSALKKAPPS